MNRISSGLLAAALGAASILTWAAAANARDNGGPAQISNVDNQAVAAARAASARYHDVNVALADGFVASDHCAELPGVGGMGYHFVNPANVMDGVIDVAKPEMLLYAPGPDGLRLAGVEYFSPDADQDPTTDADRPSVLGVDFNGPMPGHEPGMPMHYDLHVWLWYDNPDGLFAPWNPRLSCPAV